MQPTTGGSTPGGPGPGMTQASLIQGSQAVFQKSNEPRIVGTKIIYMGREITIKTADDVPVTDMKVIHAWCAYLKQLHQDSSLEKAVTASSGRMIRLTQNGNPSDLPSVEYQGGGSTSKGNLEWESPSAAHVVLERKASTLFRTEQLVFSQSVQSEVEKRWRAFVSKHWRAGQKVAGNAALLSTPSSTSPKGIQSPNPEPQTDDDWKQFYEYLDSLPKVKDRAQQDVLQELQDEITKAKQIDVSVGASVTRQQKTQYQTFAQYLPGVLTQVGSSAGAGVASPPLGTPSAVASTPTTYKSSRGVEYTDVAVGEHELQKELDILRTIKRYVHHQEHFHASHYPKMAVSPQPAPAAAASSPSPVATPGGTKVAGALPPAAAQSPVKVLSQTPTSTSSLTTSTTPGVTGTGQKTSFLGRLGDGLRKFFSRSSSAATALVVSPHAPRKGNPPPAAAAAPLPPAAAPPPPTPPAAAPLPPAATTAIAPSPAPAAAPPAAPSPAAAPGGTKAAAPPPAAAPSPLLAAQSPVAPPPPTPPAAAPLPPAATTPSPPPAAAAAPVAPRHHPQQQQPQHHHHPQQMD